MKKHLRYREMLTDMRRVVVKIGTRVLAQSSGRPDARCMTRLAGEMSDLQRDGYDVVVVSSGAIGAGMEALGMKDRPSRVPDLQMAAAVGQCRLMARYDALFARLGCKVGQVLLTHDDFQHKIRFTNACRTLENLLRHRVIPIINENDVVADEEIKADLSLGDNDLLAALVARMIRADILILLTTVDGLRSNHGVKGRSRRIACVESVTQRELALVTGAKSALSKGGMDSKLRAAQMASKSGCLTVIANGRQTGVIGRIMGAEDVGTLILSSGI
jgi:glutamate 5-kinase